MESYSVFWARLLGFYLFILAMWCFFNINDLYPMLMAWVHDPANLMTLGVFILPLGLAIILSHSIWKGWPTLVTVLGYWITFKGIVLLFFPVWIHKMILLLPYKNILLAPIPALIIGLILLFYGFVRLEKKDLKKYL
jgi:hypothetical protein